MTAQTQNRRQSRLPWLGELPIQWQVERARFIFQQEARPPRDDDGVVTAFRDGQVTSRENRRMGGFTMAIKEIGYQGVRRGDLVIHTMDAFAGAIGVSESDGKCTGEYAVCNPVSDGFDNRYYAALLREMALKGYIHVICPSVRERAPRFRFARLKDVYLPVPPPSTQKAIAAFLDRKTAAIDALIEKKQKLLDLLAEKRAALINQAVTKGLDPNVPMKDSGIPWIGEIPAHWEVKRLKFMVTEAVAGPYGASLTKAMYSSSGYRVYGQQQVILDDFSVGDYYISPEKFAEMRRYLVYPGDLLVSVMGTIGKVAVVPDSAEPGIINPRLVRYRPDESVVTPRFMQAAMLAECSQAYLRLMAQGSTMDGLNMGTLAELALPLPPLEEQHEVLRTLQHSSDGVEGCTVSLRLQLDRLKEYRQALITAAVTGQLDITEEDN